MNYIVSVDLGTTAIKVALFDEDGQVVAKSNQEYTLLTPSTVAVELAVEVYWRSFSTGVKEILGESGVNPGMIKALGMSAQGETLILIDKDGKPLRRAIVWLDNRAHREAERLSADFDNKELYRITGQVSIVPTWPASKLLWVRENEPEVFSRIAKVLLIEDYFIFRLTGSYVAEGSLLCSTVYWDILNKTWWREMLDYLRIEECQLPEIRESGEPVGPILPKAARELGLSSETVVCMGALDQAAGTIGVGNIKPGVFSENTGAALAICVTVPKAFTDPLYQMPCHYHGIPDTYMAHTFTTGGMVLKWYRDMFCRSEMEVGGLSGQDSYDVIGREVETVGPGCDGLVMLPHLQGAMAPEDNPKAKGVLYGLTLRHGKAHFARAIMEAIACIVRRNIEVIEILGISVKEIRVLGGGARSAVWNQIKADLTGRTVITMKNEEAPCLGAALLAGVGIGLFPNLEAAVQKMVQVRDRFIPDPQNTEVYETTYAKYLELYKSMEGMFAKE